MRHTVAWVAQGIVNVMLGFVAALLGLRFILKLFNANATNDFVNWIYEVSSEILGPFRNVFTTANVDGFVIEFSTIFALMVYAIIGLLAYYVIDLLAVPTKK